MKFPNKIKHSFLRLSFYYKDRCFPFFRRNFTYFMNFLALSACNLMKNPTHKKNLKKMCLIFLRHLRNPPYISPKVLNYFLLKPVSKIGNYIDKINKLN